jgi:hypothetical protein
MVISVERSASGRPARPNSLGRLGRAATALTALGAALASSAAEQAAPPPLDAFVEIADVSAVAASPDGRRVAFRIDRPSIERNSYRLAWHVLDLSTGEQKEIASAGEPIVNDPGLLAAEAPIWSPDGRWIYYRALRSGAVQIWRSAADGSRSEAVTAEAGDVLSFERTADGRGLAYRVGPPRREIEQAELAEYEEGILVDEHVELGQNVFRGAVVNGRRATQRLNGPWFNRSHVLWARAPLERRLDFMTLRVSEAGAADFLAPPTPLEGGRTPDAYARSSRGDLAAASWNWTEGSLVVIRGNGTRIACPIQQCRTERTSWVSWRPDRDEVVFATADRARVQTLRLWNPASGEVRSLPRMNGQISGGPEESTPCAIVEARALCVLAEPASPPRLEVIDLGSGAALPLFDPNASARAYRWPRAERLTWRSPTGHIFTGVLFLPEAAPPTGDPGLGLENVGHKVLTYRDLRALTPSTDTRVPARTVEIHLTGNMERFMWSIDGEKFSENPEPIRFERNERVRVTMINHSMMTHPMHIHGHFFEVVNGQEAKPIKHTVMVLPGAKLSFDMTADAPGDWAFHCHLLLHMHAGMMRVVTVRPLDGDAA